MIEKLLKPFRKNSEPVFVTCPMCDAMWLVKEDLTFQCKICGEPIDARKMQRAARRRRMFLIAGGKADANV